MEPTQSPSFLLCGTPISSKVFGPLPGGLDTAVLGGGVAVGRSLLGNFGGGKGPVFGRTDGVPGVCTAVLGRGPGALEDGVPCETGFPFGVRPSFAKVRECGRLDSLWLVVRSGSAVEFEWFGNGRKLLEVAAPLGGPRFCIRFLPSGPVGSKGAE